MLLYLLRFDWLELQDPKSLPIAVVELLTSIIALLGITDTSLCSRESHLYHFWFAF